MNFKAIHRTDAASAAAIIQNGFDIRKFGTATRKAGQSGNFRYHPRGIFLSTGVDASPDDPVPHPWNHRDRGVYIFCNVTLQKPYPVQTQMEGKFYQQWLSESYGGAVGARLTSAMQREGYDGIYCEESGELVVFRPDQIQIDKSMSLASLETYQRWKKQEKNEWKVSFSEWLTVRHRP